jgi:hypothetical protein
VSSSKVISTPFGNYIVRGIGRFALAGDLTVEVPKAVQEHVAEKGFPPDAVVWDDAAVDFRAFNLTLGLSRIVIPWTDPWLCQRLDCEGRCAVRIEKDGGGYPIESEVLSQQSSRLSPNIARTERLLRFVGSVEMTPLRSKQVPSPAKSAQSISVILNYRDKAEVTIAALQQIATQKRTAQLELIVIDNQSRPSERLQVDKAVQSLFGSNSNAIAQHVSYDFPFNHSYQCNYGATLSGGEVLVMMSNDCKLLSEDALQTLADWALEPGIAGAGPRIVSNTGSIVCSGIAIADRAKRERAPDIRIFESETDYLSREIRASCGVTFACAAISRAVWFALGGADSIEFPVDYNDADFSLRCSQLQLRHVYVGILDVQHQPGLADQRSRDQSTATHQKLLLRHDLKGFPWSNPHAIALAKLPTFDLEPANQVCDIIRLYRQAHAARGLEAPFARDLAFLRSFESLVSTSSSARYRRTESDFLELFDRVRAICREYLRIAPRGEVPERYRRALEQSGDAFERINNPDAGEESYATRTPMGAFDPNDPDPKGEFYSYSDRNFETAQLRLLVFADTFGLAEQSIYIHGLMQRRMQGGLSIRIITGADWQRLLDARGPIGQAAFLEKSFNFLRPTACVFSKFADWDAYRVIDGTLRGGVHKDVPRILTLEDDLLDLPATSGINLYQRARSAKRGSGLRAIANDVDLVLTTSTELKKALFREGASSVVGLGVPAGVKSNFPRPQRNVRKVGYFATEAHASDLALIAPQLRTFKGLHPEITIEIVGSIAKTSPAVRLSDVAMLDPTIDTNCFAFRQSLSERGWSIGLMPLANTAFNRTKVPIKWLEYSEVGIATVCSNVEAYRYLGHQGAALLVNDSDWSGTLASLVRRPERLDSLLKASYRVSIAENSWQALENRVLSAITRVQRVHSVPAAL